MVGSPKNWMNTVIMLTGKKSTQIDLRFSRILCSCLCFCYCVLFLVAFSCCSWGWVQLLPSHPRSFSCCKFAPSCCLVCPQRLMSNPFFQLKLHLRLWVSFERAGKFPTAQFHFNLYIRLKFVIGMSDAKKRDVFLFASMRKCRHMLTWLPW